MLGIDQNKHELKLKIFHSPLSAYTCSYTHNMLCFPFSSVWLNAQDEMVSIRFRVPAVTSASVPPRRASLMMRRQTMIRAFTTIAKNISHHKSNDEETKDI